MKEMRIENDLFYVPDCYVVSGHEKLQRNYFPDRRCTLKQLHSRQISEQSKIKLIYYITLNNLLSI